MRGLYGTIAGSILFAAASAANAQQPFETKPDIHGDRVVFTAEGDLWLGSIASQTAHRLTSDPATETDAHFSPDGNLIAFSAQYEGGLDVYKMPIAGGPPERLTYDPSGAEVQGWTPDGKGIVFRSVRGSVHTRHLFVVPAAGGTPAQLPVPRADFGSLASGGKLAYVPVSWEWANWFHYHGGSADKIWLADLTTHKFTRLTDDPGVDTTPTWAGNQVYFVSERSGWTNLWQIDPQTKAVCQCTQYSDLPVRYPSSDGARVIFQHGGHLALFDPATRHVTELNFQTDSDHIHEREQRVALATQIGPATMFTNGSGIGPLGNGFNLGPTGKRILLEARGQIVSIASAAGDMRVLEKKPGARARFPVWAPDGKRFAFVTDRTGENELWIGDAAGGSEPRQLTHGLAANPYPPVWSPDGKWIALYDRESRVLLVDAASGVINVVDQSDRLGAYDNLPGTVVFSPDSHLLAFSRINPNWLFGVDLYEISSGRKEPVNDGQVSSYAPAFDSTGKFLLFLSDNALDPTMVNLTGKYYLNATTHVEMVALSRDVKSPFLPKDDEEGVAVDEKQKADEKSAKTPQAGAVEWDGLTARIMQVPLPAGQYSMLDSFPGHILVLDQGQNPSPAGPPLGQSVLLSYDIETRQTVPLAGGIDAFQVSVDRKKLLLASGRRLSVHDLVARPTTMAEGAVDLSPYSITFDPKPEWRQIFEESWRIARDFYYDPKMHGLDWNAVRKRYEALVDKVGDRPDLSRLLANMVSELNTGHAYVLDPTPRGRPANVGFLGIDVEPVPNAQAVKIVKLLTGDPYDPDVRSPLLEQGMDVHTGDYILEIAGQPVNPNKDFMSLMIGTQGQTVAVMVNSRPTREGARVVRVRPLSSETELRYEDWVNGRTRYVLDHGGPDIGYCHIPDMESGGLTGFLKGQLPNVYKAGMIYDDRYNGGGFVSALILEDIASKVTGWFKPRYGAPWTRETWANIGHKAALCNEYDFSDGEYFIESWKALGIGPVVGTRTGGGEVGSGGGYRLIDGGAIYIPDYGAYRGNEWLVEGHGAIPTVPVEDDPNEVIAGRDPQLDKAIEVLKAEIAKSPVSVPQHPPFPPGH
jgi:tricorn protease